MPTGIYFARIRVKDKLIRKGLKTVVLSVAKLRLSDFEKFERHSAETHNNAARGKLTFGEALEIYRQRISIQRFVSVICQVEHKICNQARNRPALRHPNPPATWIRVILAKCILWPRKIAFRFICLLTRLGFRQYILREAVTVEISTKYLFST